MPNNNNNEDNNRNPYGFRGGLFSPMRRRPSYGPGGPQPRDQRPTGPSNDNPFTPGQPGRNPFVPGPPSGSPFPSGQPGRNPFVPGPPSGPSNRNPFIPGPPGRNPFPPESPGDDTLLPPGPPPSLEPRRSDTQPGFYAVDPGAIRFCLYKFTYIWLENGRGFWMWPVYIGRNSIAGYRWNGYRWVYFGTDLENISDFECY